MSFMRRGLQRAAGPCSAAALLQAQSRHREARAESASWQCLEAYALDQVAEVAAGRGPRRLPPIDERYRRYFRWAAERGQTGAQYLVTTAQWRAEHGGPWVALEPNIVAYDLDAGIEHWNLWYHPGTTPGSADLDLQPGAEVLVSAADGAAGGLGRICRVRRITYGAQETYDVRLASGEMTTVGREHLQPLHAPGRWAAVLRHVRLFLPSLQDGEVVVFQNVPELRSVPEVAHAHVFLRPRSKATQEALRELRLQWRDRSPWAEHERLGGRGHEVGFDG